MKPSMARLEAYSFFLGFIQTSDIHIQTKQSPSILSPLIPPASRVWIDETGEIDEKRSESSTRNINNIISVMTSHQGGLLLV